MKHPYSNLPDSSFWRKFVSDVSWRDLNINSHVKFILKDRDKVITAGSCFAQHIARYMKKVGLDIFNAEPAHQLMMEFEGDFNSYSQFSARYGNVYTARQCKELLMQASGEMQMVQDFVEEKGRWYDLLRPGVQKEGFASLHEAQADRRYHLSRVKQMFLEADVFIFTLGLTECWYHKILGHTYPACPGTVHGSFDPELHIFKNMTYSEIIHDMEYVIEKLHVINPDLKMILTVSPVPLVATRTEQNVLIASSYSKSVLRVVAGDLESRHAHVSYFPSFEIISHVCSFGQYLASDLREVTERGVSHVMDCFLKSFYAELPTSGVAPLALSATSKEREMSLPPVECEEIFNTAPH